MCHQIPITAGSRDEVLAAVIGSARRPREVGTAVHLCNAYVLTLAAQDPGYGALFRRGGLNLADGAPVAWAVQRGGAPDAAHIRGTDLLVEVVDRGREQGLRHYLLGGAPGTPETIAATLEERLPGAGIVGAESPPFHPLDEHERAAQSRRITDAGADVVWVGLGTPKQDHAVADIVARTGTTAVAVGAAFDFLAGEKPEAPVWMQRSGLEWTFRLGCEPTRLWKRYLVGNSRFVFGLLRHPPRRIA